jgi:glycosyltransferase involved in cell wall biosynthesis
VQLRASIGRPDQYRVIRSPIDIDRFAAARDVVGSARDALRERFGVRPGAKVAVAVGALEARKRHALILGELAGLIRAGQVDLVIAGDGPERESLGRLAASLAPEGGVRLLGHLSDVPDLLAASDLLVHASTAEGVPQVVIQALAAGLPVVATEVVGLREVPDAPVRVLPSDGAGIASAVQRVAEGPPQPAVPLSALDAWRPSSVEDQIASMHREVAGLRRA